MIDKFYWMEQTDECLFELSNLLVFVAIGSDSLTLWGCFTSIADSFGGCSSGSQTVTGALTTVISDSMSTFDNWMPRTTAAICLNPVIFWKMHKSLLET